MAVQDVLRSFAEPPYGMPSPEGPGVLPEEQVPDWMMMPGGGPPPAPDFPFVSVVDIDNGMPTVKENSAINIEGEIRPGGIEDVTITGDGDGINPIVVNSGEYKIDKLKMDLKGDGYNDFDGIGAGVMSRGESVVELRDSVITTEGVIRPCTFVRDEATLKVYNCTLTGEGGTLPEDYVPVPGPGMKMAPVGLKISGNCRTHLSVGNSKAYFYDSTIIADGWAALSTDGCTDELYLEANNCDVICRNSGYGTYSDGGCIVRLNNCRVKTGTHASIMAGDCQITFDGCDIQSGAYCAMIHCVRGCVSEVSRLFVKDCKVSADEIPFFIKSQNAYIGIDNSYITSKSGDIVHSILNDDTDATEVGENDNEIYGIKVSVKDSAINGNIIHDDNQRTLSVTLTHSQLTGIIKDAYIALLQGSKWTASANSSVALIGVSDVSGIDAYPGVTIHAVAGAGTSLSGEYSLVSGGKLIVE